MECWRGWDSSRFRSKEYVPNPRPSASKPGMEASAKESIVAIKDVENASDSDRDITVELIQTLVQRAREKFKEALIHDELHAVANAKYDADRRRFTIENPDGARAYNVPKDFWEKNTLHTARRCCSPSRSGRLEERTSSQKRTKHNFPPFPPGNSAPDKPNHAKSIDGLSEAAERNVVRNSVFPNFLNRGEWFLRGLNPTHG